MPRIAEGFVDMLVQRADIVDVLGRSMQLHKAGREFKALCPFHPDKRPSLTISPQKQFYYCFSCGAGGDALRFLREHGGLPFVDAVQALADIVGMDVEYEKGTDTSAPKRPQGPDPWVLLGRVAGFYQRHLARSERARRYLAERGVSADTAEQYSIGYAPAAPDHLHRDENISEPEKKLLLELGVFTEHERHGERARFRDRIMFPICDLRGRVQGFGGRVLDDDAVPKYLNSPESQVFHKGEVLYGLYQANRSKAERLLVAEGYMDVVALAGQGVDNAVATLGTATTDAHIKRLFRHTDEIVFCYDGDHAGRRAAERAFAVLLPSLGDDRRVRFAFMPEGEDPDSLVRRDGVEGLQRCIDTALGPDAFLIARLSERHDLQQIDGRAAFADEAAGLLALLPRGALADLLAQRVIELVEVSASVLREKMEAVRERNQSRSRPPPEHVPAASPDDRPPPEDWGTPSADEVGVLFEDDERFVPQREWVLQGLAALVGDPGIAGRVTQHNLDALVGVGLPGVQKLLELITGLIEHRGREERVIGEWAGRGSLIGVMEVLAEFPVGTDCLAELNYAIERLVEDAGVHIEALLERLRADPNTPLSPEQVRAAQKRLIAKGLENLNEADRALFRTLSSSEAVRRAQIPEIAE